MVQIIDFSCGYNNSYIIKNFNATFEPNRVNILFGKSGVGKSTLLKAINRLHECEDSNFFKKGTIKAKIDSSLVDVYKEDVIKIRRNIGYIFQSPTPLPFSIEKNVAFGLEIAKAKNIHQKVIKALKDANLYSEVKNRLNQSANRLSLGQQQRLAIARALVLEPQILLFDEPTSSLDLKSTLKIEELLIKLSQTKTVILVTHNQEQIKRLNAKVFNI